jgi:glucosamine-6-phosphate deaminase
MKIHIYDTSPQLGKAAGTGAASLIKEAIDKRGAANIILATGTSQFETLNRLVMQPGIDWSKVIMFHLDEYIGLPETHPASFRKYLLERFISKLPTLQNVYLINGGADPATECSRLGTLILKYPIDVALVGIGENGHLAFNDPPADFETEQLYIVVELDEACRKQQLGEGWFNALEEVPRRAISMSIKQIMKSRHIICSVPDKRKAVALKNTLEEPVSNRCPASILQQHPDCTLYLDKEASSLLSEKSRQWISNG